MADGKDRAASVFGNEQDPKVYEKACRGKEGYIKKFGDDSATVYHLRAENTPAIGDILGVKNLVMDETGAGGLDLYADAAASPVPPETPRTIAGAVGKPLVVGNIRMGFGHYRISMAMASAARAMGFTPYWFDLASFSKST